MNPEKFVQQQFTVICQQQVTDAYLLPMGNRYRFLFNHGQEVSDEQSLSPDLGQKIITYLKYQANMAVSEHRRPQAGAWRWQYQSHQIDIRLSTVGDFQGQESLVLRFIYPLNLREYRMVEPGQWTKLQQLTIGQGLLLFAGPMGSGKTTTMYRLLREQAVDKVILTIEDPVEITEPRFVQLQVNTMAGMDYPALLHLGLRHRPQVLIIGEIRDAATAQCAIEAALSGHLVLATIHAKSARGVVPRLRQLGIADYYIDQALLGACYQRIIPVQGRRQRAVFFDLQSADELLKGNGGGISEAWQTTLQKLYTEGQITAEVKKAFWNG
ncbi:competence type IV pilus ATPase ComGA [Limosilactobacillus caecicola]|uniref:competence type IV pilus ATPase ComGA n=1 Tax=Limosilactobacillus caecicola TaxID=2941332 RepID=UPI00203D40DF|nr:competence type IV pilus ATPase ComGA [Limosilactobacillus caecicola]